MDRELSIGLLTFCRLRRRDSRSNCSPPDLNEPRAMTTAPNGDIFLAESHPRRHQGLSRNRCRWQAEADRNLRQRTEAAVRHRVLSSRAEPAVHLHREHGLHRSLRLQQRRPESQRRSREDRRPSRRRRPLDARPGLLAGRQAAVRRQSDRTRTSTIPTLTRTRRTAPTFW